MKDITVTIEDEDQKATIFIKDKVLISVIDNTQLVANYNNIDYNE